MFRMSLSTSAVTVLTHSHTMMVALDQTLVWRALHYSRHVDRTLNFNSIGIRLAARKEFVRISIIMRDLDPDLDL